MIISFIKSLFIKTIKYPYLTPAFIDFFELIDNKSFHSFSDHRMHIHNLLQHNDFKYRFFPMYDSTLTVAVSQNFDWTKQ